MELYQVAQWGKRGAERRGEIGAHKRIKMARKEARTLESRAIRSRWLMLGIAAMPWFLHRLHLSENLTDISFFFLWAKKAWNFLFYCMPKCASTEVKCWKVEVKSSLRCLSFWPAGKESFLLTKAWDFLGRWSASASLIRAVQQLRKTTHRLHWSHQEE